MKTTKRKYNKKKNGLSLKKLNRKIEKLKDTIEIKCHTVNSVITTRTAGVHPFSLNVIRKGTADNERIGDQVVMKYMDITFMAQQAILESSTWCRAIVLCNKINDNDTTSFFLTEFTKFNAFNVESIFSVRNEKFMTKYKVYHDKIYNLQARGTVAQFGTGDEWDKKTGYFRRRIQLNNAKVHYTKDDGNTGDILDKVYKLVLIFDRGNAESMHTVNLFYTDA